MCLRVRTARSRCVSRDVVHDRLLPIEFRSKWPEIPKHCTCKREGIQLLFCGVSQPHPPFSSLSHIGDTSVVVNASLNPSFRGVAPRLRCHIDIARATASAVHAPGRHVEFSLTIWCQVEYLRSYGASQCRSSSFPPELTRSRSRRCNARTARLSGIPNT